MVIRFERRFNVLLSKEGIKVMVLSREFESDLSVTRETPALVCICITASLILFITAVGSLSTLLILGLIKVTAANIGTPSISK